MAKHLQSTSQDIGATTGAFEVFTTSSSVRCSKFKIYRYGPLTIEFLISLIFFCQVQILSEIGRIATKIHFSLQTLVVRNSVLDLAELLISKNSIMYDLN